MRTIFLQWSMKQNRDRVSAQDGVICIRSFCIDQGKSINCYLASLISPFLDQIWSPYSKISKSPEKAKERNRKYNSLIKDWLQNEIFKIKLYFFNEIKQQAPKQAPQIVPRRMVLPPRYLQQLQTQTPTRRQGQRQVLPRYAQETSQRRSYLRAPQTSQKERTRTCVPLWSSPPHKNSGAQRSATSARAILHWHIRLPAEWEGCHQVRQTLGLFRPLPLHLEDPGLLLQPWVQAGRTSQKCTKGPREGDRLRQDAKNRQRLILPLKTKIVQKLSSSEWSITGVHPLKQETYSDKDKTQEINSSIRNPPNRQKLNFLFHTKKQHLRWHESLLHSQRHPEDVRKPPFSALLYVQIKSVRQQIG